MGKKKDIQNNGIVFGDWKMVPLDSNNWELCHRHVTKETNASRSNGTAGTVRWHRCGRYYQHDTFANALRYVADEELKRGCADEAKSITDALREYERITVELMGAFRAP